MLAFFNRLPDDLACVPGGLESIWLNVSADVVIAVVSFAISAMLMRASAEPRSVDARGLLQVLALIAATTGLAHALSVATPWTPVYGLEGIAKALVAAASVAAAITLWRFFKAPHRSAEIMGTFQSRSHSEADDMLRQAEKMDAIGQLTGGVAHDFNNLLTIVSGNLEIADRSLKSWGEGTRERLARAIANAAGGAQRAAMLTQRLLAFARLQPLDPKVTDINDLIGGMADFVRRSVGPSVQLEIRHGAPLWRAEVDLGQMEAAINNLVINAREAMAGKGSLTIETRNGHIDQAYSRENAGVPVGDYVQVSVSDTGRGMSREVQAKAFDPFFTTKQAGQGTGLGLSQVYGFVRQSGGHLKIQSDIGKGTTVRIYLPRAQNSASDVAEVDGSPMIGAGGGETIFVVEDEADIRSYLVETLGDLNYRVREAADGGAALAMYDASPFHVDLLLTDVVMPGINGRQLAREMQSRIAPLKVLFISGYAGDAVGRQGRLDAGVSLLQKPLSQDMLARRIRELLDQRG